MPSRRLTTRARLLLAFGLLLTGLSCAACLLRWHGFTLREWWREGHSGRVRWQGDTRTKLVTLTFDDGPDPRWTPRVLEILRAHGVSATFFQIGRQVEAFPALARAVVAQGNDVGNHTWSHPYLDRLPPAKVADEIDRGSQVLETTLGRGSHWFRPPRGDWNPTIFRAVQQRGDTLILWTIAVEHHEVHTPRAMADRALRLIRPGAILLLHDGGTNRSATVEALPLILEGLTSRGYRCVPLAELLKTQNEAVANTRRPGQENTRL